jgi:uncharacterized protein YjbI with pentapeptide repeats
MRLQNEWVVQPHHICLFADLVLLVWFFGRLRGDDTWHFWRAPLRRKVALCWMPAVVLAVDLWWLEVPRPAAKTVRQDLADYLSWYPGASAPFMQQVGWLIAFNPVDLLLCKPGAWGCRFLAVHRLVVPKVWDSTTFVAVRADGTVDAKHLASFEPASLRDHTLRFADLSGSELFAVDLSSADLRRADLSGAQLQGADLGEAQLQDADVSGARLQGAHLREALLQGADLSGARLQGADLSGALLQGAHLREALLQGAHLRGAQLQGAYLFGAQLQGADLGEARLQDADLSGAQLQDADLSGAQLQDADLSGAQLQGAELRGAQLQGADLHGARLQGADLGGAQLQGASLFAAELQGAYLGAAQLPGANLLWAQLQGAYLGGAQLQGADLYGAQLQGAYLGGTGLWNITADRTRFGLADLRGADFIPVSKKDQDDLLAKLSDSAPADVKQRLRDSLIAKAGARTLPRRVDTKDGKILVSNRNDAAWQGLDRITQLATDPGDIDTALADLLGNTVAPTAPQAAEHIALRVIRAADEEHMSLIKPLGCRLQAQATANKVKLDDAKIQILRKATGTCDQPSP